MDWKFSLGISVVLFLFAQIHSEDSTGVLICDECAPNHCYGEDKRLDTLEEECKPHEKWCTNETDTLTGMVHWMGCTTEEGWGDYVNFTVGKPCATYEVEGNLKNRTVIKTFRICRCDTNRCNWDPDHTLLKFEQNGTTRPKPKPTTDKGSYTCLINNFILIGGFIGIKIIRVILVLE